MGRCQLKWLSERVGDSQRTSSGCLALRPPLSGERLPLWVISSHRCRWLIGNSGLAPFFLFSLDGQSEEVAGRPRRQPRKGYMRSTAILFHLFSFIYFLSFLAPVCQGCQDNLAPIIHFVPSPSSVRYWVCSAEILPAHLLWMKKYWLWWIIYFAVISVHTFSCM